MFKDLSLTGMRWSTFFLAGLALSIGWGIRGNFGHENGAMIPGALTAIVVCLLSGRADWRERVAYFAMFGSIGWAFGGAISYMRVIGYTHSGDALSQYYGFFGLFLIGFLWGGMGGAGTAFPAVADKDRMNSVFRPFVWLLVVWGIHWACEEWSEQAASSYDQTWKRHHGALYWFDTDWLSALTALATMCVFELRQRWFRGTPFLLVLIALGAFLGWVLQGICNLTGLSKVIAYLFVWPQGDIATLTALAAKNGMDINEALSSMMYNWPNFLVDQPGWAGPIFGALAAAAFYFRKWGRFTPGASLIVHMAAGWLIAFLLMPVMLNFGGAGLRMTPPRGDDWAGIIGVFIGTMIWLRKNQLVPVIYAALIAGTVGGLGFAGAAWIKLMLLSLGHKELVDPETALRWQHWQGASWHSFLEQTYGFINGLGIALAMGLLARRVGAAKPGHVPRAWTEIFAVAWVLFGVGWLNISKNVPEWVDNNKVVPAVMKAPLFSSIELSATTWFNLAFWAIAACVIYLMYTHKRRPIALLPDTALGKGQLLFLVFLWAIVIANFERALAGFSEGRLLTEWVIIINAVIATLLILVLPRNVEARLPDLGMINYDRSFSAARRGLLIVFVIVCVVFPWTVRARYDGKSPGHAGLDKRFGPEATWRIDPLLKGQKHK